jgi:hypothetical protein
VSESHDGGAHWSDATGTGTVRTTSGAFFEPAAAITAATARTVVSMYRANTAQHTTDVGDGTFGYGYQVNAGTGFGAYQPASDGQAYPSPQANVDQQGFLGDYSSVAASSQGDVAYLVWSDTRNSSSGGPTKTSSS